MKMRYVVFDLQKSWNLTEKFLKEHPIIQIWESQKEYEKGILPATYKGEWLNGKRLEDYSICERRQLSLANCNGREWKTQRRTKWISINKQKLWGKFTSYVRHVYPLNFSLRSFKRDVFWMNTRIGYAC